MTDERIIEEMARLDGKPDEYILAVGKDLAFFGYLTDHNAVQRVIDGLGDRCHKFCKELERIVDRDTDGWVSPFRYWVHTTPRQKSEAILKAVGKWEDNGHMEVPK